MKVCPFRLTACFAFCCVMVGATLSGQTATSRIRRIYVEPFATQEGSAKFREDIIGALGKVGSVSVASDEASADAILGGGGEIWIKGYRSHNPQLGNVPSNGTPIYTGFLSIELRDTNGETLWSYLVTPPAASGDISKDLSTQIVNKLAESLQQGAAVSPGSPLPQPSTTLTGAGATFPYPVYAKWFTNYRRENPALQITYEPTGSEAGIRRLLANDVDFGASDSPEAIHELAPQDEGKYLFFPSVAGALVPVVNLPGVSNIAFTPEALAGIYLGKIKKWNDPILKRANRGLHLPDLDIVVVHRADGSGTSYAWTDYLSRVSPEWKTQVGTSLTPKWPTGREAEGNEGVSSLVKEQIGSIGYVEFIYALQNHLSYGRVQNREGEFVAASLESIAAAVSHSIKIRDDFKVSIADPPGAGVYPISTFTWIVVPAHSGDNDKRIALTSFLQWMLGPGQRQAAALGYLPLPKDVVTKEAAAISRIH